MNSKTQQGIQCFDNGDIESAIPLLQTAIEDKPDNVDANFFLGVCNFRKKEFNEAERHFRKVVSINNAHYNAQYYLGLVLERQNRLKEEIIPQYRIALALKPDFKEAREKLVALNAIQPIREQESAKSEKEKLGKPGVLLYEGKRRIRSFSFLVIFMFISLGIAIFFLSIGWNGDIFTSDIGGPFIISLATSLIILGYISLQSYYTRYTFYEKRIDFMAGILFRKKRSLWIYQIEDTWVTRTPFNLITRDATVHIRATGLETISGKSALKGGHFRIIGLGNYKHIERLWVEIRDAGIVERRGMKNWFI